MSHIDKMLSKKQYGKRDLIFSLAADFFRQTGRKILLRVGSTYPGFPIRAGDESVATRACSL